MISRRNFLHGILDNAADTPPGGDFASALPPEFTPAMRRLEAARLGLDPDAMSEDELTQALLGAMRPPSANEGIHTG